MVGVALILAGIVAFIALPPPYSFTLLFAGASTGLFIALVASTPSVPRVVVDRILSGASEEGSSTIRGLSLAGKATYVPPGVNLARDRVFIAASDNDKPVPLLDDETVIHQGPPEFKTGMAIMPPGIGLVEGHAAAVGADMIGAPLPEAEAFIRGLGLENGLFQDFRMAREGERLVATFQPTVTPPCLDALASDPPCDRSGCALCSAVGCTLARSMARPMGVAEAGPDGDRVIMAFEVGAGDMDDDGIEPDGDVGPARSPGPVESARPSSGATRAGEEGGS